MHGQNHIKKQENLQIAHIELHTNRTKCSESTNPNSVMQSDHYVFQ